jgi:hypothetical protein
MSATSSVGRWYGLFRQVPLGVFGMSSLRTFGINGLFAFRAIRSRGNEFTKNKPCVRGAEQGTTESVESVSPQFSGIFR